MKQNVKKIIAMVLVVGIIGGVVGTVYTKTNTKDDKQVVTHYKQKEVKDEKTDGSAVYVFANEDGSINKMIATDDLLDDMKMKKTDTAKLEKDLPIKVKPKYILDGKEVQPKDLVGKSGKLIIRYDFENVQSSMMNIDGKQEKVYVPYIMVTGCILDHEIFDHVEVSNGKMMDDGSHVVVAGLALPGLQENLNVDKGKLEIPEYFEIKADVKNYEPVETLMMATNEVFHDIDTSKLNSIDDLNKAVHKLSSAMDALMNGSAKLYDGLKVLDAKSGELVNGVDQLANGANSLTQGTSQVNAGASKLLDGANQLTDGLKALYSNNDQLQGGALEIFETLLKTANDQLAVANVNVPTLTVKNYDEVLGKVIASLDKDAVYQKALAEVTKGVEAKRPMIQQAVTGVVKDQVKAKVEAQVKVEVTKKVEQQVRLEVEKQVIQVATKMTKDQYDAAVKQGLVSKEVQEKINATINEKMSSEAIVNKINATVEQTMQQESIKNKVVSILNNQMETAQVKALITQNTDLQVQNKINEIMASDEIKAKFETASQGLQSIVQLKTSLNRYETFYKGLMMYTNGVESAMNGSLQLKGGLETLNKGTKKLDAGANQLQEGLMTMQKNTPALINGIQQLTNGASQLSNGLIQFNEEGISKLVKAVDGDVKGLLNHLKASVDVSKNHPTFGNVSPSKEKQIKYIYRF